MIVCIFFIYLYLMNVFIASGSSFSWSHADRDAEPVSYWALPVFCRTVEYAELKRTHKDH